MRWILAALACLAAVAAAAGPRFVDHSAALPLAHVYSGGWEHFVGGGVAVFDCDGDGDPDIAAAGGAAPARLFLNQGGAAPAFALGDRLPTMTGVTGLYPLDVDGDGAVDLAVLRVGPNRLLRGDGACGFTDAAWGFQTGDRWSTAFSATWEPGAAWPTLAVGNYVDRTAPDGPFGACDANMLYQPAAQGFAPPAPLTPGFCALSMLFSDWRREGAAELRVSNDRHYYLRGGYEQMWRLSPLAERGPQDGWAQLSIWGMGVASADLQRDGLPDVMLTSMGDQVLLFNEADGLRAAGYDVGATAHRPHTGGDGRPSTGWHAEFGDVDNDGLLDLFIAKGNVDQMPGNAIHDPNSLLMGTPDGRFVEAAAQAGVASTARSRGAALADLNGDGLLDLVVVNRRAPLELWLNATPEAGGAATVDLRMAGPNRDAIGAWLEIDRPGGAEWRERTVGGGHASGSLLPLHIGLGAAERLRVRVWWPDGAASAWRWIAPGDRATIARP